MSSALRALSTVVGFLFAMAATPSFAVENSGDESASAPIMWGLAVSVNASPYAADDDDILVLPLPVRFTDPAFTDGLFVLREGSLGLRWVVEDHWHVGVLGRLQYLGFKSSDSPTFTGMAERSGTVELGPFIGYRSDTLQYLFLTYFDALDEHGGMEARLSIQQPCNLGDRYFVVHADVVYQNADMLDYYFGVLPGEATVPRPAYAPGSAMSTAIGGRAGWKLTDRLALFAEAEVQFMASEIKDSPIVDSSTRWGAFVMLAYDF